MNTMVFFKIINVNIYEIHIGKKWNIFYFNLIMNVNFSMRVHVMLSVLLIVKNIFTFFTVVVVTFWNMKFSKE